MTIVDFDDARCLLLVSYVFGSLFSWLVSCKIRSLLFTEFRSPIQTLCDYGVEVLVWVVFCDLGSG